MKLVLTLLLCSSSALAQGNPQSSLTANQYLRRAGGSMLGNLSLCDSCTLSLGTTGMPTAGDINLPNAGKIAFEASPAAADGIISFSATERFTFSHALTVTGDVVIAGALTGATTGSFSSDLDVGGQLSLSGDANFNSHNATDINLLGAETAEIAGPVGIGPDGVTLDDDGDGALVITGRSAGSDESLTWNFDDVSNEVGVSSTTSVSTLNFADAIGLNFASLKLGGANSATATDHFSATASLNFTALAANTCEVLTITVTGAADGDTVFLGVPTALADVDGATERTLFYGWVSGSNTVSVRRCNVTGAITADPGAATVRADVWRH